MPSLQEVIIVHTALLEVAGPAGHSAGSAVLDIVECVASQRPGSQDAFLRRISYPSATAIATSQGIGQRADRIDLAGGHWATIVPDIGVDDVLFVCESGQVVHTS
jgi:hypothetical protein